MMMTEAVRQLGGDCGTCAPWLVQARLPQICEEFLEPCRLVSLEIFPTLHRLFVSTNIIHHGRRWNASQLRRW